MLTEFGTTVYRFADVSPLRLFASLDYSTFPQRFLLIQLKLKHVFRRGARGAVFRDTRFGSFMFTAAIGKSRYSK